MEIRVPKSAVFRAERGGKSHFRRKVPSQMRLGCGGREFEPRHSDQRSAEIEVFRPTFGWFFACNRLLSTTLGKSPDGRNAACAIVTAQAAFFRKAFSLTTATQFLRDEHNFLTWKLVRQMQYILPLPWFMPGFVIYYICQYVRSDLTSFGSWKHERHRIVRYGCIISRHMFVFIHAISPTY